MPTGIDYRGGLGGSFGGSGFSGGGGGGASASVIFINGVTVAVAGGGGGGGGGGQYSPGLPNNNNPGTEGTTFGGYGEGKGGGDGAGGGGGGGGANASANYPPSPSVPLNATTNPAWNSFLNSYGVWFSTGGAVGVWTSVNFTVDISGGNYYFVVSADNHIELYVNGNFIVRNDDSAITNSSGSVSLSSGFQTINIQALNDVGPAGFAAAMYDLNNNMIWNSRVVAPAAGGGGLGGLTYGGDNGAYSGENGNCYVPPGGVVSSGSNGGAPNTTGGGGLVSITYWS